MLALIDGDIFTRRYTAAAEYTLYTIALGDKIEQIRTKTKAKAFLEEEPDARTINIEECCDPIHFVKHSINLALIDIQNVAKSGEMEIFLGGKEPTFRHEICGKYKSSRKAQAKPTHYEAVYNWLIETHEASVCTRVEADDAIAIHNDAYPDCLICTNDKDLLQLPGEHYNFITRERQSVTTREGNHNLFQQILMGDSVDDIEGIKGVGKKKSVKILKGLRTFEDMYDATVSTYKATYGKEWKDHFMLTGSLVYLLRGPGDCFADYLIDNGISQRKLADG